MGYVTAITEANAVPDKAAPKKKFRGHRAAAVAASNARTSGAPPTAKPTKPHFVQ
jgi:hypothetical protein